MNLFSRRSYFLLASLNYSMNLFSRRSYFLLASLNYLMNLFSRRSYFLLAPLNYLMNLFSRRSYFLLARLNYFIFVSTEHISGIPADLLYPHNPFPGSQQIYCVHIIDFWGPITLEPSLQRQEIYNFGPERGRRGSPRAHTRAQRSHGLHEGF